jgi:S-(hydroxymethyl)glutathione dehydrogenase/alcohol dehydrogenase
MKTLAAVLVEPNRPVELEELEIPPLKPGQVLVEVAFSAVCHTQVLEWRGYRGEDRFLPHCLGHEGSGTVRETGPGVTKVRPGDAVILSWIKGSGHDVPGTCYRCNGHNVNAGAITTFSRYSVISENRLTPLADGISLQQAVLLGCAVPTGVGAVLNTGRPQPGQSLAVFGCGGVGLCAVAGAAAAGCTPVLAVDIRRDKLALAARMGATHLIHSTEVDPVEEVLRICPGGVDYCIEVTGRPAVMRQALACVRCQGGSAVIVGNARHGEVLQLDPHQFNLGKRLLGTWGGDNWPDRDYPRYGKLVAAGKVPVELLLSRAYALRQINDALQDLENGAAARPLIDMALE